MYRGEQKVAILPVVKTNIPFRCHPEQNTTASGSAGAPDSYLIQSTLSESGNQARWNALYYSNYDTGHQHGYIMEQEPTAADLVVGNTVTFKVKTWSTKINYNTPYLYANTSGIVSSRRDPDTYALYTSIYRDGEFNLNIAVACGNNRDFMISRPYTVFLLIKEGTYFFMNREVEQYMQCDDDTMEVVDLNRGNDQMWVVQHYEGKYYKIKSAKSYGYITVPSDSYDSNNVTLQLQDVTNEDGQLWYFEKPHDDVNSYVIKPKSGEGNVFILR